MLSICASGIFLNRVEGSELTDQVMRGPWRASAPTPSPPARGIDYLHDTASLMLDFYSTVLHPALSTGCPCIPSCSEYARDAITRFGIVPGTILALERLMHESGEIEYGRTIRTDRGLRIFDPLSANTNWLFEDPATR